MAFKRGKGIFSTWKLSTVNKFLRALARYNAARTKVGLTPWSAEVAKVAVNQIFGNYNNFNTIMLEDGNIGGFLLWELDSRPLEDLRFIGLKRREEQVKWHEQVIKGNKSNGFVSVNGKTIKFKGLIKQRLNDSVEQVLAVLRYRQEANRKSVSHECQLKQQISSQRKLNNNKQIKFLPGYVYAVTNAAWPGWIKIGSTLDITSRMASFQTSDPFQKFKVEIAVLVDDRRAVENAAHDAFSQHRGKGEWFFLDLEPVKKFLQNTKNIVDAQNRCSYNENMALGTVGAGNCIEGLFPTNFH